MSHRTARRLAATGAAGLALALTSCAKTQLPQDTFNPAGPEARTEAGLFWLVFWIAVAVFVVVEGILVVALFRFRHRPGAAVPKQVHGNKRLEIGWTILPALLLAGIAFPTVGTVISLSHKPTGNILELNVTAHQFWWEVNYPSLHIKSASEIHVPVNTPVYVSLRSIDVIHSFWIPRLAGKQDVVPNQVNHLTFEADKAGMYRAQCAEFCGLSHANMRFQVVAQSRADFDAWVGQQQQPAAEPAPGSLEAQGQDIFEHGVWSGVLFTGETVPVHGCTQCHTVDGIPGGAKVGPNLTHFAGRAAFAGAIFPNNSGRLALWLRDPDAVKPGVDMPNLGLSEQEINALVAYLESLK